MILPAALTAKAQDLLGVCITHGATLAIAESCTGGLVAAALTSIPGCSRVFDRGFIVYDNEAKSEMLGVPSELIAAHGVVSRAVAKAMAEGAIRHSHAVAALSVTGIAGPDGGSPSKPVGTVHVAAALDGAATLHAAHLFEGDRDAVRVQSALAAMELMLQRLCAFRK